MTSAKLPASHQPTRPAIVVAGLSARMLAESARRADWRVIALDLFGDSDTRRAADSWQSVGDPASLKLDPARVRAALERASEVPGVAGWIAGSGFETCPELLRASPAKLPLIGNSPTAHEAVRTPGMFFALLEKSRIAFPETQLTRPRNRDGWLCKAAGGTGGSHIRHANAPVGSVLEGLGEVYYQRLCAGRPMSVLFLADGRNAIVLGINEQIVVRQGERPFVWRGAIGPVPVSARLEEQVRHAVQTLVEATGLVGLNSLDFLDDRERCVVLEVNARPSATMALYDHDARHPLFARHLRACQGEPVVALPQAGSRGSMAATSLVRGHYVVFARASHVVPPAFEAHARRLGWCHDIPIAGSTIPAGAPLCTVSATCARGTSAHTMRSALAARAADVEPLIEEFHERVLAHR